MMSDEELIAVFKRSFELGYKKYDLCSDPGSVNMILAEIFADAYIAARRAEKAETHAAGTPKPIERIIPPDAVG